ncbi:AAA family ATPase [Aliiroseovarius sp. YM-037]|uniref:AAA family ATPase n=1 Tax=Aliiroseovarius sp. YM-037 TaxID=3341728 RepID=UPI003A7FCA76
MTMPSANILLTDAPPTRRAFVHAVLGWVRAALTAEGAVEMRARLEAVRVGSPLDHLSRTFALTPADEDILLFALAHRIDGGTAPLCAEVAGDPRQGYVTAHLLTRAVGGDDPAFAAALFDRLTPDAPLRHRALVEMREAHALSAIGLTEDIALRLVGAGQAAPPRGCFPLPDAPPLERFEGIAETLAQQLSGGVALLGPSGCGRRALASAIAERAGLGAVMLDRATLPESATAREPLLRAIARDARLDGIAVVIDADPDDQTRQFAAAEETTIAARAGAEGRGFAAEVRRIFGGNVILLAKEPTGLPPGLLRERLIPLTIAEREALWHAALGPRFHAAEAAEVARHFPLGPSEIADVAGSLSDTDPPGTLWHLCRGRGGQGLEALATRIVPRYGWDDLILPGAILDDLHAIAAQLRHRMTVYDAWGFGKRLSAGQGVTALFAGPSGVGKTMAAEVIASELNLDLYKVDLSRLVSKYIGETEKNLRRVFDAAEDTGACLFLDEADACLGKRSEVKDSHDRHANIEVSYLLQRMESYSGLCLLATNLKNNLDAAFLRRLRFVIDIPFPDQGDRLRIWQGAFPPGTPTKALDFTALSRLDISGGSIMVIAVNAAFLAAAEGGSVTMNCIARAARGEFRKHDRTFRATWKEGP